MEKNSRTVERLEAPKSMKDQKERTAEQSSKTKQLLPTSVPKSSFRCFFSHSMPIRKRKRNDSRDRKLKLPSVRKIKPAPPAQRGSPEDMQVHSDQAEGKLSCKRKMDVISRKANSGSLSKARELQINLKPEMPSFIKFMRRSHVSSCFWLRIPGEFCKLNMPKKDCSILLVDAKGEKYNTQYLDCRGGLGGGWKRFSTSHRLVVGDSLVFQLVEPTKFKVYVIGNNGLQKCFQGAGNLEEILIEDDDADEEASLPLCVIQERVQNERRERNPKLLCVRNSTAPSCPSYPPEYTQVLSYQAKNTIRYRRRKDWINEEAKSCSMKKAKELQMKLAPEMPSFVKFMLPSVVSRCFWLSLPVDFCKRNMPKRDCIIMLVNESGEEYETKYLAYRGVLSGGWRRFSTAHELIEGDSVVFHLVEPTKFKVFIVGKNGLPKCSQIAGDRALGKEMLAADNADEETFHPLCVLQESNHNVTPPGLVSSPGDEEEIDTQDLEGNRSATSIAEFKEVKSYEDFTIIVNGWNIDSKLSEHVRAKYYELCCSQKAFLHDKLNPVISCKSLIAGIISEIVNVAEFLKSCNLTTAENEFKNWDSCLDAFERLGMNVGFLSARVQLLVSHVCESDGAKESKMYNEAVSKRACLEKDVREKEMRLMELNREIETLKLKATEHKLKLEGKVNAPW